MSEYVYIVDFGDKIKIGYSTNIIKRLNAIRTATGTNLQNSFYIESPREKEKQMHYQLEKHRLIGEYFNYPFDEAVALLKEVSITDKLIEKKRSLSKANQRAVAKYMKNNYDDIKLRVKKGNRQIITDIAKAQDKSLNAYIKNAISNKVKTDTGNDIDL